MGEPRPTIHRRAARDFEREVRERYGDAVVAVYLYGSVARGDHRPESDVDLLVVTSDDVDRPSIEETLRDLAYDIELDAGIIVSLVVLSETAFGADGTARSSGPPGRTPSSSLDEPATRRRNP